MVIKKEPNQLYGAVGTVEGLDTTRKRAKKIQRYLLNHMRSQCTQAPCLIVMKTKSCNICWCCQAFLSLLVVDYVTHKELGIPQKYLEELTTV
jgi:hypothetical protein